LTHLTLSNILSKYSYS